MTETPTSTDLADYEILIVDGKNCLWRNVYANAELAVEGDDGEEIRTGGVFGFLTSIQVMLKAMSEDTRVFICWEGTNSRERRQKLYKGYKVRPEDPKHERIAEMVHEQGEILKEILEQTGWTQCYADTYEADDVMATIAARCANQGLNAVIYSSDHDMLQCLVAPEDGTGAVIQYMAGKTTEEPIWTVESLFDRMGIEPWQIPHMKALSGDSSDCYPGVPGIGEKTACKILSDYPTVSKVIEVAECGDPETVGTSSFTEAKRKAVRQTGGATIRAFLEIAIAINNVPDVKVVQGRSNQKGLERLLRKYKFHSIMSSHSKMRSLL